MRCLEDPPVEDDGLTLEQAVLRALARRGDAETMDQLRKTRLLRHIEELADWAQAHLASVEARELDPESQILVDKIVDQVLTEAGGEAE